MSRKLSRNKHVESVWLQCLDAGSTPANSTKKTHLIILETDAFFLFPYTVVNNLIITFLYWQKIFFVHTWFIYLHFIFVHIFQCDIVFLYLCVWKERQMVHLSNDRQMLLMLYFQKRCHCEERITILKRNNRKYFFEIVVSDCWQWRT